MSHSCSRSTSGWRLQPPSRGDLREQTLMRMTGVVGWLPREHALVPRSHPSNVKRRPGQNAGDVCEAAWPDEERFRRVMGGIGLLVGILRVPESRCYAGYFHYPHLRYSPRPAHFVSGQMVHVRTFGVREGGADRHAAGVNPQVARLARTTGTIVRAKMPPQAAPLLLTTSPAPAVSGGPRAAEREARIATTPGRITP
jgi:hypothetical protein